MSHTVEKIGGTSMTDFSTVRNNIIFGENSHGASKRTINRVTNRIMVVSAYGGITDMLLEHKKSGEPGVYAQFASNEDDSSWHLSLRQVRGRMHEINQELFEKLGLVGTANAFIDERLDVTERCLEDLERLCEHGHFSLDTHLMTVREMLASLGEAHSAWNMTQLLKAEGVNARFIDLSGWESSNSMSIDEHIKQKLSDVDLDKELPIVTGYVHCADGVMATFDRGYSEMTFSRIAVITGAEEALIHKEYHLSTADPRIVGADKVVPIGRTNYDVADQLANLGMEAIHPRAAKGLRQSGIPLRVKNTFEPEHSGTLITGDYVSEKPCVEIIAGRKHVYALEFFDQDMVGDLQRYETGIMETCKRFKAVVVTKDVNANSVTHYLGTNLKSIKRIRKSLEERYPDSEMSVRKVAIISAIGSDMQVPGMLAKTVSALADAKISVLAVHQSMRQVDMQFVVDEENYELAVKSLHRCLIEIHDHGDAICAA